MNKAQAKCLLINVFDGNSLTFRDMDLLKSVFDEALADCDEDRAEKFADYHMGRGTRPLLPPKDIEDDFYHDVGFDVEQSLRAKGIAPTPKAVKAIAEFAVDFAEIPPSDFYFSRVLP